MTEAKDSNFLVAFYAEQMAVFSCNLSALVQEFAEKPIHKFRVSVKYLRAMHQLAELISKSKYTAKKLNKPFRKIYLELGKIREAQVNMGLCVEFFSNEDLKKQYLDWLQGEVSETQSQVVLLLAKYKQRKLKRSEHRCMKVFASVSLSKVEKTILKFILKKNKALKKVRVTIESEECFHNIRKLLKEIKAVSNVLLKQNESKYHNLYQEVNRAEKLIGAWHDLVVLRDSLSSFF